MRNQEATKLTKSGIKPGDIITAYKSGFHIVTRVEERYLTESDMRYSSYKNNQVGDLASGLVWYRNIADATGKPRRGKVEDACDEAYCTIVDKAFIENMRIDLEERIARIERLREMI